MTIPHAIDGWSPVLRKALGQPLVRPAARSAGCCHNHAGKALRGSDADLFDHLFLTRFAHGLISQNGVGRVLDLQLAKLPGIPGSFADAQSCHLPFGHRPKCILLPTSR